MPHGAAAGETLAVGAAVQKALIAAV